jgi:lysophospholipase L1-like esterase
MESTTATEPQRPPAENNRATPRLSRLCFGAFACLMWIVVGALALELSAAATTWWTETHNEFILAAKLHQSRPDARPASPLQDEQGICQACATQPGWDSFARAQQLPAWAEPKTARSKEEAAQRRSVFAGLDEPNRNLFALLNDELVLEMDGNASIRRVYGNWLFRAPFEAGADVPLFQAFKKRLRDANVFPPTASTAYLALSLDLPPGIEDHKEILLLKAGESGLVYAFIDSDFQTLRFTDLPPDTPWDGIPFFRYKKNLRNGRSGLGMVFDTNNYGFRDRDVAVPKPPDVLRLLCIGGSTTEEGPTNDATYPKLLEKALNAQFGGGKRIEVLNCGVSGLTTSGHVARLADYLALEPDMLVFYEGVNDVHRDLAEFWRTVNAPVWRRLLSYSRFARWQLNSVLYPNDTTMRKGIQNLFIENLRAIGYVARGRGIRMAICSVPCPDARHVPANERRFYDYCARTGGLDPCLDLKSYAHIFCLLNEEVRALCAREGFLYVPVAEHIDGGYDTFTDIYHMTNSGIERKAQAIFECTKEYLRPAL